MYKTHYAQVKSIIKEAKSDNYASEIEQCGNDNKRLYRLLKGLLQRRKSPCLPANDNMLYIATSFSNFFCSKIDTIRVTLNSTTITDQHPTPTLTGATYSVYTHWRYVLSLHSTPPRSQTNIQHPACHNFTHFRLRQYQTSATCSTSRRQHRARSIPYQHGC